MNRIKKYETGIVGSFLLSLLLLFSSCQNTGLMYDVSQPGTVYFVKKASADAPVCSFVFAVASSRPNENASSGILLPVCLLLPLLPRFFASSTTAFAMECG